MNYLQNGEEDTTSILIDRTCRQEIAASEEDLSGVSMGKTLKKVTIYRGQSVLCLLV